MLLDFLYNRLNFLELWHGFHSGCVWLLGKSWSRIEMSFEFFFGSFWNQERIVFHLSRPSFVWIYNFRSFFLGNFGNDFGLLMSSFLFNLRKIEI